MTTLQGMCWIDKEKEWNDKLGQKHELKGIRKLEMFEMLRIRNKCPPLTKPMKILRNKARTGLHFT